VVVVPVAETDSGATTTAGGHLYGERYRSSEVSTTAINPGDASRSDTRAPHAARRGLEVGCRLLDLAVSAVMLVLALPLMLVIAAAIRLESRGPVLFRQRRVGLGEVPFTLYKFRTMREGASHKVHQDFVLSLIAGEAPPAASDGGPAFKLTSDPRVTRVGRVLRRTSLDELPQLLNVLRGQMSLVGPRPPIPYEVEHYPPHWFGRFAVKPGLTGLWQVNGRSEVTLEEMIKLDLEYVQRRSVWLNVWILVRTIPAVLSLRGAS
jgi:lipopolysaccharide/colanic/teichoic acid biosynthesis glycosyltransferase